MQAHYIQYPNYILTLGYDGDVQISIRLITVASASVHSIVDAIIDSESQYCHITTGTSYYLRVVVNPFDPARTVCSTGDRFIVSNCVESKVLFV